MYFTQEITLDLQSVARIP